MPTPVVAALTRWRTQLIDLTRRNPLLHLRPTLSSYLEISFPSAELVFERLVQAGKPFRFWQPPCDEEVDEAREDLSSLDVKDRLQAKANELVCGDIGNSRLKNVLTNLYRRARSEYQERGLHVLFLACGVLDWRDRDESDQFRSPLLLVPVDLTRAARREPFTLTPSSEEDVIVNPALAEKLRREFNLTLPAAPEEWKESTLATYLTQVKDAVAGQARWRVEPAAVLTLFSFFKGVMVQDLVENEEQLAQHPLIRALAGEGVGDALQPQPLAGEHELDALQKPEETFDILDADASQRLALEAVRRGHSFVLHGPPGTGKSQTIANLIADCMARDKTVLFVSEKMAALEVVYQRLRHVGLGDFCLELHSHKANKRAVVTELKRCLEERKPAGNGMTPEMFQKLAQTRERLNRYVAAIHQVREPLQRSAWDVLNDLIACRCEGVEAGFSAGVPWEQVTPAWLENARAAMRRAEQLWHVGGEGEDYHWFGFVVPDRYTPKLRDEVIALIDKARQRFDKLKTAATSFAARVDADGPVAWLLRLGELLDASPKPPAAWLTMPDLPALAADLERCAAEHKTRSQGREPLTQRYGPALWNLPDGTADQVDQARHAAAPLLAAGDDRGAGLLTHQQLLRGWAADTQKRMPGWLTEARTLEKWLGVTLPGGAGGEGHDPSPQGLRRLLRLANLCMSENLPERAWLTDAAALEQAETVLADFGPRLAAWRAQKQTLLARYKPEFFELDLVAMAERFAGPYRSWLRIFNGQYRRDRRAIVRRTQADEVPSTLWDDMAVAGQLGAEHERFKSAEGKRKPILGRYEKGVDTNHEGADRAAGNAREARELARDLECPEMPAKLVDALTGVAPATEKIRAAAKRLHDALGPWLHETEVLEKYLPMDSLPATGARLDESALTVLGRYARDLQTTLNHFAHLADPALAHAAQPPADAAALVDDLRQAEALRRGEATQESEAAQWRERFGLRFQGVATDWDALRKTITWTQRVRELFQPNLPSPQFVQLASEGAAAGPFSQDLHHAREQLDHALHAIELRFATPGPRVGGKKLNELALEELQTRLQLWRDKAGELADWIDWKHLDDRFDHLGLARFWGEVKTKRPAGERLQAVLTTAALGEWFEQVCQQEAPLGEFRQPEHEQTLTDFRTLDRALVSANAARVAHRADQRQPTADAANPGTEVALLLHEAHKKARHLPVRRLLEKIGVLVQQVKPCLLMSPLSVSQFLPAAMRCDVVVFDEASQIVPEDALGAILRGTQVVITGDDQQLPPTPFFQALWDEEETDETDAPAAFESILSAAQGAGLRPHLLRWHYRSRHESLIAFSNHDFYDNRLVTFPAARQNGGDLGVSFHHVADGVYDRGGRRDNRREAQVVADLVFDHVRAHGERRSLGVIAFSQAQMNAIEDEIDRRLAEQPELEPFFKADRLGGFFVKNLETVQGDERDVILFSVGYGRDVDGRLTMHFGPLNAAGGQRRLNVAVTRAREKLVVVSSIRAAELDLEGSQAEGVAAFQRFLAYAENGLESLTSDDRPDETLPLLLKDVAQELKKLGYDAEPQVGCGTCRVNLGVVDPRTPGRFLLGIALDGPSDAATARDRDRLRPEVLGQLGWSMHRVRAPAWYQRRAEEVERLKEALKAALGVVDAKPPAAAVVAKAPAAAVVPKPPAEDKRGRARKGKGSVQ